MYAYTLVLSCSSLIPSSMYSIFVEYWCTFSNRPISTQNDLRPSAGHLGWSYSVYQCPRKTKERCYKTLVRPQMEYASIIWDPHTANYTQSLEMVQRRAARFVTGDFYRTRSANNMLHQLQWPTLQERRAENKVIMMFRIVNNLVAIPTECLIPTAATVRGHNHRYLVPYARTDTYQRSFFPDTIRLWNNLPSSIVACNSINTFKSELQNIKLR